MGLAQQRAGGGVWNGCIYDVDRIVAVIEAGLGVSKFPGLRCEDIRERMRGISSAIRQHERPLLMPRGLLYERSLHVSQQSETNAVLCLPFCVSGRTHGSIDFCLSHHTNHAQSVHYTQHS